MSRDPADPAVRIAGLYDDHAEAWAKLRAGSTLEQAWLDRFAALLPKRGHVLDLGCGSGEPVAAFLTERGLDVTGVDSSSALIAICETRLPDQRWIVGDMRRLDLGREFDGVIAWHSLFHLPPDDQRAMFARLGAHTRSGGVLMFTSGHEAGIRVGDWQEEPLYHASLAPKEYAALLEANGFALVDRELRDPSCGDASVWIARRGTAQRP